MNEDEESSPLQLADDSTISLDARAIGVGAAACFGLIKERSSWGGSLSRTWRPDSQVYRCFHDAADGAEGLRTQGTSWHIREFPALVFAFPSAFAYVLEPWSEEPLRRMTSSRPKGKTAAEVQSWVKQCLGEDGLVLATDRRHHPSALISPIREHSGLPAGELYRLRWPDWRSRVIEADLSAIWALSTALAQECFAAEAD